MKVLFIQAKNKNQDRFQIHPPYGLLYLASVLRKHDISVKIYDANIKNLERMDDYYDEISAIIKDWSPDIVGIGGMVSSFKFVKQVSYFLKAYYPDIPLIGGGLLISAAPKLVMKNTSIDIGCIGEAEEIIVEFVKKIYYKESLESIPGLVLKKRGNFIFENG